MLSVLEICRLAVPPRSDESSKRNKDHPRYLQVAQKTKVPRNESLHPCGLPASYYSALQVSGSCELSNKLAQVFGDSNTFESFQLLYQLFYISAMSPQKSHSEKNTHCEKLFKHVHNSMSRLATSF